MADKIIPFASRGETIANDASELIGCTPMVYLSDRINKTKAKIALKLESENPVKSVKDRLALSIVEEAEKAGKLIPGKSTVLECTSGNTGVGLAFICAVKGYRCIIVMPENMSLERRILISSFGAELVLTPMKFGIKGAKRKLIQLMKDIPNSFDADQFNTEYNEKVHYQTTGPEIWKQTAGKVAAFVSGQGTSGTISGVGRYLKEQNPEVKVFGIEPTESPVLNGEKPGPHKIQGIGPGFVPGVYKRNKQYVDTVLRVSSEQAIAMARELPKTGLFTGISAGAAVQAALQIGEQEEFAGKLIAVIIPSFGERYLSTVAFQDIKEKCQNYPVVSVEEMEALPPHPDDVAPQ